LRPVACRAAPFVEHDRGGRGDLVASLRARLAPMANGIRRPRRSACTGTRCGGGWVGRQLLDRDLDSPTVRSQLWLALEVAPSRG